MSGNKIREMNQKFMCMWLEKEIESDAKKMDEFVNAFSKHCVRYVLKAIVEGGIPPLSRFICRPSFEYRI